MKKIYHLATCNTCQRILSEIAPSDDVTLQELKENPITETQLETLRAHTDSYEQLFNRRAQLYRKRGLHEQTLSETDYKNLILEHYTFLKRPVMILEEDIFIGNNKKTVAAAKEALANN